MRVLLVDDNHELRLSTRTLLENSGYRVLEASRGLHALDLTESRDVDLLVTGLSMPGMDGLDLADRVAERLHDRDQKLAVVLMSDDSDYPRLRQRLLEGGMAFLRKPFTASELATEIDSAFARKARLGYLTEDRVRARQENESRPIVVADSPGMAVPLPVEASQSAAPRPAPAEAVRRISGPVATASDVPASASSTAAQAGQAAPGPRTIHGSLRRRPVWRRGAWGLTFAAVLTLSVAGTLRTALLGTPPALPPPPSASTPRSAVIEALEPRGSVAELPAMLRWKAAAESHHYRVEVRAVDDRVLWSGSSRSDGLEMPAELAALLHPAVTYTWRIEAFDERGVRIAWSAATPFRVAPAGVVGDDRLATSDARNRGQ